MSACSPAKARCPAPKPRCCPRSTWAFMAIRGWVGADPTCLGPSDVDHREPRPVRPQQAALPERPDRRRVGAGDAPGPASQARRQQADGGRARGRQRSHACAGHRLPVACDPPGTWPRAAPPSATRRAGTGTAPWSASTTRSMCDAARWPGARPARQRPSLKAGDVIKAGSGVSAAVGPG